MPTPIESGTGKNLMYLKPIPGLRRFSEGGGGGNGGGGEGGCLPLIRDTFTGSEPGPLSQHAPEYAPMGWAWRDRPIPPEFPTRAQLQGNGTSAAEYPQIVLYGPTTAYDRCSLAGSQEIGANDAIEVAFPYWITVVMAHNLDQSVDQEPGYSGNDIYPYSPTWLTQNIVRFREAQLNISEVSCVIQNSFSILNSEVQSIAFVNVITSTGETQISSPVTLTPDINGVFPEVTFVVEVNESSFTATVAGSVRPAITVASACPNSFREVEIQFPPLPSYVSKIELTTCGPP